MELRYHLLDVFTDVPFGGNQLAVFTDAPDLPGELMQRIARELNLSETVFVRPPQNPAAAFRLRIFTPGAELPFAGHPTIGTAHLLAELGLVPAGGSGGFALEEGVGLVRVTIGRESGHLPFVQLRAAQLPVRGPAAPPSRPELAGLLGVSEADLAADGDEVQAVSAGVPFLIVPMRSRAALGRAALDLGRWRTLLAESWAPQVYVFCREPERAGADFRVRMFSPGFGIAEDPATGSAAAAFAGYLAWQRAPEEGTFRWVAEQGVEMGRPSVLALEADVAGGAVRSVRVGGTSVRMGEGTLRLVGSHG